MKHVLVILPGFGEPHWEHKLEILEHNLYFLTAHPSAEEVLLDFVILQYTTHRKFPDDFFKRLTSPYQRVRWHKVCISQGIVGENLHRHLPPYTTEQHDYVLILLDDVEFLAPVDWEQIRMILDTPDYDIDIVSPCLKDSTMTPWPYMVYNRQLASHHPYAFTKRNRCELFVYFMKSSTYEVYYSYIDPENPYLWGMDLILSHVMRLNVAIVNQWVVSHHYKATGAYHTKAIQDADRYLSKYHLTLKTASQLPDNPMLYSIPTNGVHPHNDASQGHERQR